MTDTLTVSPTLIVGLGGTGSLALQFAKQKIRTRLKSLTNELLPQQIPFIEYVMLDTILTEDQIEAFIPDEFMDIGRMNISRALESLRSSSDERILNWFPRHLDPGQIDSGAGGVRAIGRLCFFLKESEIEDRIKGKVKKITSSAYIQNSLGEYLDKLRFVEAGTIDVHFVSSLCGGTGSACLLDTAYLVQHIIRSETKLVPNCTAHLLTTEPFENEPGVGRSSREYIQRNFAISLSEIEHFNSNGLWDVEYRNGTKVRNEGKPFSLAYLLGYKNGVSLNRTQICEIVGETIAINCLHPAGRRIKGDIENHKPHVINTRDTNQKLRTYSSYNTQILTTNVEAQMLEAGSRIAQASVISSLCAETNDDLVKLAFNDYEQQVFGRCTEIPELTFEKLTGHVKSKLAISPRLFEEAPDSIRYLIRESPRKRRKPEHSQAAILRVNAACESPHQIVETNQKMLRGFFKRVFPFLIEQTDQEINRLITRVGFDYVSQLLTKISTRLSEIYIQLENRERPTASRNFNQEIAREIVEGRADRIAVICNSRAEANTFEPIFDDLLGHVRFLKQTIDERRKWCDEAREFLQNRVAVFLLKPEPGRRSHTVSSVWTLSELTEKIEGTKEDFIRGFLILLEHEYKRSDINKTVCFLPRLSNSDGDPVIVRALLERACNRRLTEEIRQQQQMMLQKAAEKVHEFVDLASPAWQIEKTGEDVATVAITNCPENSSAGQIISSLGKNISFSRNGAGQEKREIILFRSEHGASVNHLSNFKKCLDAVDQKMQIEGIERLGDLCLDPRWNVAAPLPLRIEDLRLEFTLAIHFSLISVGFDYEFKNEYGETVKLRQNLDRNKATRRFEAFGKLMDLDRVEDPACKSLRKQIRAKMQESIKNEHMATFREELSNRLAKLALLISSHDKYEAVEGKLSSPDETQLRREHRALSAYIHNLDEAIKAMEDNSHGTAN